MPHLANQITRVNNCVIDSGLTHVIMARILMLKVVNLIRIWSLALTLGLLFLMIRLLLLMLGLLICIYWVVISLGCFIAAFQTQIHHGAVFFLHINNYRYLYRSLHYFYLLFSSKNIVNIFHFHRVLENHHPWAIDQLLQPLFYIVQFTAQFGIIELQFENLCVKLVLLLLRLAVICLRVRFFYLQHLVRLSQQSDLLFQLLVLSFQL